jgi:hypothetical protein
MCKQCSAAGCRLRILIPISKYLFVEDDRANREIGHSVHLIGSDFTISRGKIVSLKINFSYVFMRFYSIEWISLWNR